MLPARHRLKDSADFAQAVRGVRAGSRLIVVHANQTDARAGQHPPRVGFVVSKAVGNAVVRARTKRVLRALMSARVAQIPDGVDVVVRAGPPAAGRTSAELATDLDRLLPKVLHRMPSASGR